MSQSELEQALKRPLDFDTLSARRQWDIDKSLGILDWAPDQAEADDYIRRRAEMGDKRCQTILEKRKK